RPFCDTAFSLRHGKEPLPYRCYNRVNQLTSPHHMQRGMRTPQNNPLLDVPQIPPPERPPPMFGTIDSLAPGASLERVNDHDPKRLYYQFRFETEGEFEWEYLEAGPRVWRVSIARK